MHLHTIILIIQHLNQLLNDRDSTLTLSAPTVSHTFPQTLDPSLPNTPIPHTENNLHIFPRDLKIKILLLHAPAFLLNFFDPRDPINRQVVLRDFLVVQDELVGEGVYEQGALF